MISQGLPTSSGNRLRTSRRPGNKSGPSTVLTGKGGSIMNVRQLMEWLWSPPLSAPRSTVLIRSMAGGVFLWEGVLKFVYVNQGVGRFQKIGIPSSQPTAPFLTVHDTV